MKILTRLRYCRRRATAIVPAILLLQSAQEGLLPTMKMAHCDG